MRIETVFLFDLDGALVDSAYQHVLPWREPLDCGQRTHGDSDSQPCGAGRGSGRAANGYPRPSEICQAQPRSVPGCAAWPGAPVETGVVVGDSIWDMLSARHCRALGVGLLSGGYGMEELEHVGEHGSMRIWPTCSSVLESWRPALTPSLLSPPAFACSVISPS
jgi:hypothetical protein